MTVEKISLTGASSTDTYLWKAIHWPAIEYSVNRPPMRIAKAVQEGRHHKAQALQWLLMPSFQAKVLATKRVTENRGAKTAGVEGKICRTPRQKIQFAMSLQRKGHQAKPLHRVYVLKKTSPTEMTYQRRVLEKKTPGSPPFISP